MPSPRRKPSQLRRRRRRKYARNEVKSNEDVDNNLATNESGVTTSEEDDANDTVLFRIDDGSHAHVIASDDCAVLVEDSFNNAGLHSSSILDNSTVSDINGLKCLEPELLHGMLPSRHFPMTEPPPSQEQNQTCVPSPPLREPSLEQSSQIRNDAQMDDASARYWEQMYSMMKYLAASPSYRKN